MRDWIGDKVKAAARSLGGRFYRSRRGVPIALVDVEGCTYSATWFNRSRTWRVHWPWMQFDGKQKRRDFKHLAEVREFLESRKSGRPPSEFSGDISKLRDKLARFEGTPPYDNFDNHCAGDGYYRLSMEEEFGMTLAEIRKAVHGDRR